MVVSCRSCVLGVAAVVFLATRAVLSEGGCGDIPTENNLRIEDLEGDWYPMEIVLHRNDSKINGVPLNTQCPVVTFTIPPRSKKTISMTWNTTEGDLEYKFVQKGGRGQWQTTSNQSGALSSPLFYFRPFNGSMKIMKHEDNLLVLHFCSRMNFPLSLVFLSRTRERAPDFIRTTLEEMDEMGYRRAREMSVEQMCKENEMCKENDDGGGVRTGLVWLILLLPCLGVLLPNH